MKSYYSCPDTGFVKYAPQPMQHLAIADKAAKLGGRVVFYVPEAFETLASQGVIKAKVEEQPEVDGIVSFTLKQFGYGGRFNFQVLNLILQRGYEVHFARENLSIPDLETLEAAFPMLYATQIVTARDEPSPSQRVKEWRPVWDWLDAPKSKGASIKSGSCSPVE